MAAISIRNRFNRNECMNIYCKPSSNAQISKSSSKITSLELKNGILYHKNQALNTVVISDALEDFIQFIDRNINDKSKKAIIIAHNAFFDSTVIINALIEKQMINSFKTEVLGFIDTLALFRKCYPYLRSHSQQKLVSYFLKGQYNAHNACDDVHILHQLYQKALSPIVLENKKFLSKASFDINYVIRKYNNQLRIHKNFLTFEPLLQNEVINK